MIKVLIFAFTFIVFLGATNTINAATAPSRLKAYAQLCPQKSPQLELLDLVEARRLRKVDYLGLDRVATTSDSIRFLSELFQSQQSDLESISTPSTYASQISKNASYQPLSATTVPANEIVIAPEADCQYVVIAERLSDQSIVFNPQLKSALDGKLIALTFSSFAFASPLLALATDGTSPTIYARLIHSYFLSQTLASNTRPLVVDALKRMSVAKFRLQGIEINLSKPINFGANGVVLSATPSLSSSWSFQGGQYTLHEIPVSFHENGAVERICPEGPIAYVDRAGNKLTLFCAIELSPFNRDPQPIHFHRNGLLSKGRISAPAKVRTALVDVRLTPKKQRFETVDNALVVAAENGLYTLLSSASGAIFLDSAWRHIDDNQSVSFFDDGSLKETVLHDAMKAVVQNETISITSWIDFSAPGILNSAEIVEDVCLLHREGRRQCYPRGERLYFFNGLVL